MNQDLVAELARRELARRNYSEYLAYTYGDSWIANYEVGDTVVSNAGTYVIDEIGYADVTTDFMIYNGNDIYNDAAYQVAMHTCVHGRPDINWVAVGLLTCSRLPGR